METTMAFLRSPLLRVALGVFVLLHGLVHLLYVGQSLRAFEMKPGMTWPDGAWVSSGWLSSDATRTVATVLLIVSAVGFAASSAGIFFSAGWWRTAVVAAAAFSSVSYALMWNGSAQNLDGQGLVGIAINVALALVALLGPSYG